MLLLKHQCQKYRVISLAFLVALVAGCTQQPSQPTERERIASDYPEAGRMVVATGMDRPTHDVAADVYRDRNNEPAKVMQGHHFSLVMGRAEHRQADLLEQVVNVSVPAQLNQSVEDGLRYTLQHTGYTLCPPQREPQKLLYSRPLPAAHYRLGPMPLREALQILAGSAFELQVDPIVRTICYQVRDQRLVEE